MHTLNALTNSLSLLCSLAAGNSDQENPKRTDKENPKEPKEKRETTENFRALLRKMTYKDQEKRVLVCIPPMQLQSGVES